MFVNASALIPPQVKSVESMGNVFADLQRADGVAVSVFIYAFHRNRVLRDCGIKTFSLNTSD